MYPARGATTTRTGLGLPPPGIGARRENADLNAHLALHRELHIAMLQRMAQLVTRVGDDLAAAVDELVAAGVVTSRSAAVRLGLERLIDRHRRDQTGARIIESYRSQPQDDVEVGWADESSVRMIAEEPW